MSGLFVRWYQLSLACVTAGLYSAQKTIEVRTDWFSNPQRELLGYVVTVLLLSTLFEFATLAGAKWLLSFQKRDAADPKAALLTCEGTPRHDRTFRAVVVMAISILFMANLAGEYVFGYVLAPHHSPPLLFSGGAFVVWMVYARLLLTPSAGMTGYLIGFLFLVLTTRLCAFLFIPYNETGGDMLPTIDRSLGLMLNGQFPYIDDPAPAMPYWPGTFLAYWPPYFLGVDIRSVNVFFEGTTVCLLLWSGSRKQSDGDGAFEFQQVALPMFMLLPAWTVYGVNTQYAPSVFATVLFARTIVNRGGVAQALALGFAVWVNQMLGIFGLFIFPFWMRRFGLGRAASFATIALGFCLLLLSPFLVWNLSEFFRVTMLSVKQFEPTAFWGRFTLVPLISQVHHDAPKLMVALTIACAMLVAARCRTSRGFLALSGLGLFVVLTLLHRTFSHYYLPAISLILMSASTTVPVEVRGSDVGLEPRQPTQEK